MKKLKINVIIIMSNEIIDINEYKEILSSIKNEILKSQYRAMQVVNVEMIYTLEYRKNNI